MRTFRVRVCATRSGDSTYTAQPSDASSCIRQAFSNRVTSATGAASCTASQSARPWSTGKKQRAASTRSDFRRDGRAAVDNVTVVAAGAAGAARGTSARRRVRPSDRWRRRLVPNVHRRRRASPVACGHGHRGAPTATGPSSGWRSLSADGATRGRLAAIDPLRTRTRQCFVLCQAVRPGQSSVR